MFFNVFVIGLSTLSAIVSVNYAPRRARSPFGNLFFENALFPPIGFRWRSRDRVYFFDTLVTPSLIT